MAYHRAPRAKPDPVRRAWNAVLGEVRATLPHLPEIRDFISRRLPSPDTFCEPSASPLPVLERLEEARSRSKPEFGALIDALIKHGEYLRWTQPHVDPDSADQHLLDNFGYIDIASETGAYRWDGPRVAIGLWGPDVSLSDHTHDLEEVCAVLGGEAVFRSPGHEPRRLVTGGCVHHAPDQVHSMEMGNGPMLGLLAWRNDMPHQPARVSEAFVHA